MPKYSTTSSDPACALSPESSEGKGTAVAAMFSPRWTLVWPSLSVSSSVAPAANAAGLQAGGSEDRTEEDRTSLPQLLMTLAYTAGLNCGKTEDNLFCSFMTLICLDRMAETSAIIVFDDDLKVSACLGHMTSIMLKTASSSLSDGLSMR